MYTQVTALLETASVPSTRKKTPVQASITSRPGILLDKALLRCRIRLAILCDQMTPSAPWPALAGRRLNPSGTCAQLEDSQLALLGPAICNLLTANDLPPADCGPVYRTASNSGRPLKVRMLIRVPKSLR